MKFILASNNEGKIKEFNEMLSEINYEVTSLKEEGIEIEIEENGSSFYENAYIKAKAIYDITKKPTMADDSGLVVTALNGEPGIYSARYGGSGLDDLDRTKLLLKNMKKEENREAKFICVICAIIDETNVIYGEGACFGTISHEIHGENGFGYDPIFYVEKMGRTFAQLNECEKNRISHRREALDNLINLLQL